MINFRLLLLIGILTAMLVACAGAEETPPPLKGAPTPFKGAPTPTAEPIAVVPTKTPKPVEPSPTAELVEPTETTIPTLVPKSVVPTRVLPTSVVPTNVVPTRTPEEIAMVEFEGDECLTCHTDKDRLIETTALVEETPSESSGVG